MVDRKYDVESLKQKSEKGGIETTTESGQSEEARRPGSFSASFSASFSGGVVPQDANPFVPVYTLDRLSTSDISFNLSNDISFPGGFGAWDFDRRGTSPSNRTGPGQNNQRPFIFFESSGGGDRNAAARSVFTIDGGSTRHLSVISWLQSTNSRKLVVDVCNQGSGFVGADGLFLWASETDPNFPPVQSLQAREHAVRAVSRDSIGGWEYSDRYVVGDQVTTVRGFPTFSIRYNGGWVRWVVDIPDNHQYIGLFADLENGVSSFRSDVAITAIQLLEQQ